MYLAAFSAKGDLPPAEQQQGQNCITLYGKQYCFDLGLEKAKEFLMEYKIPLTIALVVLLVLKLLLRSKK